MNYGLNNKVAIVTGAARGIGAACAAMMAGEGAHVVVADLHQDEAQRRVDEIRAAGGTAMACAADVTDEDSVRKLFETVAAEYGTVNILVNNAGFTRDMRITKMQVADWDAVVDVVLKGAFLCTREAVPHFSRQNSGRVVNISSRAYLGNPGQANYSAAKAGIIGFTRAMALECGRYNVTVNAVAPGIINTDAVVNLPHYDKIREAAEKTTPIPRIGSSDDVAAAVCFLASSQASYITGDVLHVTGGRY